MKIRLIKEIDLNDKITFWKVQYKLVLGPWTSVHSVDSTTCNQQAAEALYDRIWNRGMKQETEVTRQNNI